MRMAVLLPVVVLAFVLGDAQGTVVEIPLPELQGRYFEGETWRRHSLFELPKTPIVVHGAWLRVAGTVTPRLIDCGLWPFEPYLSPVFFGATMPDSTSGGRWSAAAHTPSESGRFELTIEFRPGYGGATWDFLGDAKGEVELRGMGCPVVDLCWAVTECPEAFVDEAVFVIDAEFPVPIEPSTWGKIKALYRSVR